MTVDRKIATITSLFQSGLVNPEVASIAIAKLNHGIYVTEIETVRLEVRALDAVMNDNAAERERAAEAILKEQGLTPRQRPTL